MDEDDLEGPEPAEVWENLSEQTINSVLSHGDRYALITALDESDRPLPLSDVAEEVARHKSDNPDAEVTQDQIQEERFSLHHQVVPKLVDEGIIDVDEEDNTLSLTQDGERLLEAKEEITDPDGTGQ